MKVDKVWHFGVGIGLTSVLYVAFMLLFGSKSVGVLSAIVLSISIMVFKEVIDIPRTGFDKKDLLAGLVGLLVAIAVIGVIG